MVQFQDQSGYLPNSWRRLPKQLAENNGRLQVRQCCVLRWFGWCRCLPGRLVLPTLWILECQHIRWKVLRYLAFNKRLVTFSQERNSKELWSKKKHKFSCELRLDSISELVRNIRLQAQIAILNGDSPERDQHLKGRCDGCTRSDKDWRTLKSYVGLKARFG